MKLKWIACISCFILILTGAEAFAEDVFLCMRDRESTAITAAASDGSFRYEEMKDSNGLTVKPIISTDYNTYLPLRFICEKAGLSDGNGIDTAHTDGYFKYLSAQQTQDKPAIEISNGGVSYRHSIGEPFEYTAADGSRRTVAIYNIDGVLYAPMAYLASITQSQALWNAHNSQIMFIHSDNVRKYLNEEGDLRRDKLMELGFDAFSNHLTNSSLYLRSDGETIADLEKELPSASGAKCVTRSGKTIYYIDKNGVVMTCREESAESTPLDFRDAGGKSVDIMAHTAIVVKNKIYGIQISSEGMDSGRLFSSELDGSDFGYISDIKAYNLIMKRDGLDYYLFYGNAEDRSEIQMIELKTMDDYEVRVTDHDGTSLLSGVKQFAVAQKRLFYVDSYNGLHQIDLPFSLEDIEIIRTEYENHHIIPCAEDGVLMNNVTQMNMDYLNDILYVSVGDSEIYCITGEASSFRPLGLRRTGAKELSLFSDIAFRDCIAETVNGSVYKSYLHYDGGRVVIGGAK